MCSTSKIPSYFPDIEVQTLEEVNKSPISKMDGATEKLTGNRKHVATIQGASTGIGGVFTLSIDIPLLLGLQ